MYSQKQYAFIDCICESFSNEALIEIQYRFISELFCISCILSLNKTYLCNCNNLDSSPGNMSMLISVKAMYGGVTAYCHQYTLPFIKNISHYLSICDFKLVSSLLFLQSLIEKWKSYIVDLFMLKPKPIYPLTHQQSWFILNPLGVKSYRCTKHGAVFYQIIYSASTLQQR